MDYDRMSLEQLEYYQGMEQEYGAEEDITANNSCNCGLYPRQACNSYCRLQREIYDTAEVVNRIFESQFLGNEY